MVRALFAVCLRCRWWLDQTEVWCGGGESVGWRNATEYWTKYVLDVSEQSLDCCREGEWDGGRRLGKDARDVTGSLGGPGSFLE